jgi:hypothetical protein
MIVDRLLLLIKKLIACLSIYLWAMKNTINIYLFTTFTGRLLISAIEMDEMIKKYAQ